MAGLVVAVTVMALAAASLAVLPEDEPHAVVQNSFRESVIAGRLPYPAHVPWLPGVVPDSGY